MSGRLGLIGGVEDGRFSLRPGAAEAGEEATDQEPQKPQKTEETEKGLIGGRGPGASVHIWTDQTTPDAVLVACASGGLSLDGEHQTAQLLEAVPTVAEARGRVRGSHRLSVVIKGLSGLPGLVCLVDNGSACHAGATGERDARGRAPVASGTHRGTVGPNFRVPEGDHCGEEQQDLHVSRGGAPKREEGGRKRRWGKWLP
eukprot:17311_1